MDINAYLTIKKKVPLYIAYDSSLNQPAKPLLSSLRKAEKDNICTPILITNKKLPGHNFDEIVTKEPEKELVSYLHNHPNHAAVRGIISAQKVIKELKKQYSLDSIYRLNLLRTINNQFFFLAPVGIDEGKNLIEKQNFISFYSHFAKTLKLDEIHIRILSRGRVGDFTRGKDIAMSLKDADSLITYCKQHHPEINSIEHTSITIEKAIDSNKIPFIIAPDGICGNLIFRSLVYLGGATGYGAPIINLSDTFIDTSRAKEDFYPALLLASALALKKNKNSQ